MGVLEFKDSACDTYTGKSYDAYKQLRNLGNLTRGPQNDAMRGLNKIKGLVPSPPSLVDAALGDLENEVFAAIPDLSDVKQYADIIEGCTPLKDLLSGLGSLTDAIDFMTGMVSDIVGDVFSAAMGTIMAGIKEFASMLSAIDTGNLFKKLGLDKVLGLLDGLIDCISNMCPGPGVEDLIYATEQLQDDMLFTDDGVFDTDTLLNNVGIDPAMKDNAMKLDTQMINIKDAAEKKITGQVETLFAQVNAAKKKDYIGKISSYF